MSGHGDYRSIPGADPPVPRPVALSVDDVVLEHGTFVAVDHVTFEIPAGQVFGLLGPNGAGKTTLIRAIAGLHPIAEGRISVFGHDVARARASAAAHLAFMPDVPPLLEDSTVRASLRFMAAMHGIARHEADARIERVVADVGLTEKLDTKAKGLSRGMRQRIFLAGALLHDPRLLLLDEPASGLDPEARDQFARIVRDVAARGAAVLVSSHILDELQHFCTGFVMLEKGRLRGAGSVAALAGDSGDAHRLRITVESTDPDVQTRVAHACVQGGLVAPGTWDGHAYVVPFDGTPAARLSVFRALAAVDAPVSEFREERVHVRELYARRTTGSTA